MMDKKIQLLDKEGLMIDATINPDMQKNPINLANIKIIEEE